MSLGDLAPTKLILPAAPVQEKFLHILPGQSTKSFDSKLVDFPTKLYVTISVWNSKCSLYMSWYGVSPQRPSCKNLHVLQILVTKIANLDGFPQRPAAKKIKQQCRAWRPDE